MGKRRSQVLKLTAGFAAGAIAVWLWSGLAGTAPVPNSVSSDPVTVSPSQLRAQADNRLLRPRRAIYERVALVNDWAQLQSALQTQLREASSVHGDLHMLLLLARAFELDAQRAMELLGAFEISPGVLRNAFEIWARIDTATTLSVLPAMPDASLEFELALALVDASAFEEEMFEAVVGAGRRLDPGRLRMIALVRRAETDAFSAVLDAQATLNPSLAGIALARIGRVAAQADPEVAVTLTSLIGHPRDRSEFLLGVYEELAKSDVAGFLERVASLDAKDPQAEGYLRLALPIAAEADPQLLLSAAESMDGSIQFFVVEAALEALAAEDPDAAFEFFETITTPTPQARDRLMSKIVTGFVRYDSVAAIDWLAQSDERDSVEWAAYTELASIDLSQAIDAALRIDEEGWASAFAIPFLSDLDNPGRIADRIAGQYGSDASRSLLQTVLSRWAATDAYSAFSWMIANEEQAVDVVATFARSTGAANLPDALSMTSLVPEQLRQAWLEGVFSGDSVRGRAAMAALEPYEGESFYEDVVDTVLADALMRVGPQFAAELAGTRAPLQAAMRIADRWLAVDAQAAARWTEALKDDAVRLQVTDMLAAAWPDLDFDAAWAWARGLPDPALRRQAVAGVCRSAPTGMRACE